MSIAAYAALGPKQALVSYAYDPLPLGEREVEIEISHCGVCHSDLSLIDDEWGRSLYPLIPGHEIVGTISAVGAEAGFTAGARVGLGWQRGSCHRCPRCLEGNEHLCAFQVATCLGDRGGFASHIRADERFVCALPDALDSAAAAPLLCAGTTVFAPLRRWKIAAPARVGVVGVGGLGHLALRFLKALGCETVAFTSSPDKRAEAARLGADEVASSLLAREIIAHADRLDFILCTVPARLDWVSYLRALKPNGVLCLVGAPVGLIQFPASQLLTGQRVLCGSDIGSPDTIREMLAFAAAHRISAQIELSPMTSANAALARLRENKVRYRMVLTAF